MWLTFPFEAVFGPQNVFVVWPESPIPNAVTSLHTHQVKLRCHRWTVHSHLILEPTVNSQKIGKVDEE